MSTDVNQADKRIKKNRKGTSRAVPSLDSAKGLTGGEVDVTNEIRGERVAL